MQINLDDHTIARLRKWTDPSRGMTEDAVINRALDQFEASVDELRGDRRQSVAALQRLKEFRGALKGLTVDQMLRDRREGLR